MYFLLEDDHFNVKSVSQWSWCNFHFEKRNYILQGSLTWRHYSGIYKVISCEERNRERVIEIMRDREYLARNPSLADPTEYASVLDGQQRDYLRSIASMNVKSSAVVPSTVSLFWICRYLSPQTSVVLISIH